MADMSTSGPSGDAPDTPLQRYRTAISAYDKAFEKWEQRGLKILKIYRDDNNNQAGVRPAKFNILWSNVQTLTPAVYAKLPKADVSRRFSDNDPVGRVASLLIERALDFEIEHFPDFRATMRHDVEDRFLVGRGTAWVRYEPHVKTQDVPEDGVQITEDVDDRKEQPEEIEYECAPTDYVYWRDFGHLPYNARTWEEVTAVYRIVYMNRNALIERFGEKKARLIATNKAPVSLSMSQGVTQKNADQAKIYELWDKEKDRVFWFDSDGTEFVDERDDPLQLEGFFPCPKPLFATTTSDNLIPIPDYALYQDQAEELNILSDRIDGLVRALRVRGVYDQSIPALQRLLTEGSNNDLIPVPGWGGFSEKGGLKGSIDLLPLDTLAQALLQAYQARADIKSQIYEITGISDIIRGQTEASETATAQQIKGQYAGLRLRSMQEDVALFATELLRLKAQIICTKFQEQTILQYAAADQLSDADKQLIPAALQLLKNNPLRTFRIDVAADSLVQIDEQQMKQERVEFLTAFGGFMEKALPVAQTSPVMVPMIMELMKFGVGAFKQARQIEGVLDQAMEELKRQAAQPQPPKPDPEMMKVQAQQQADAARVAADERAEQARMMMEQRLEQQRMAHERQMSAMQAANDAQLEKWKAQFDGSVKILIAQIGAKAGLDQAGIAAEAAANREVEKDVAA